MRTGTVCNRNVVSATAEMPVVEAARLMRRLHVGTLVVVDQEGRRPVGMITDRDIVVEAVASGMDNATLTIGEIMGPSLTSVHDDEDAQDTLDLMRERGVRRIPVVNASGSLVGIVSIDDLLEALVRELSDAVLAMRNGPRVEARTRP
jgi:CBS domain-containing protein